MDNVLHLLSAFPLTIAAIAVLAYRCERDRCRFLQQLVLEGLADIRNALQEDADAAAWETRKRRIDLEVALATAEEEARQARG